MLQCWVALGRKNGHQVSDKRPHPSHHLDTGGAAVADLFKWQMQLIFPTRMWNDQTQRALGIAEDTDLKPAAPEGEDTDGVPDNRTA